MIHHQTGKQPAKPKHDKAEIVEPGSRGESGEGGRDESWSQVMALIELARRPDESEWTEERRERILQRVLQRTEESRERRRVRRAIRRRWSALLRT